MDHKDQLKHKKEEILYEMNAVKKYIDAHEYDDQLKAAWDKDVKRVNKIDQILEKSTQKQK